MPPLVARFTFPRKPPPPPPVRLSPPHSDRIRDPEQQSSSRWMSPARLIEQHNPWDMVDNMVLVIIDQTYTAALEIPGRRELKDGSVEVKCAVDADDPNSPVLTINASATRCCVAFDTPRGDAMPYKKFTSPKMKVWPDHRLARSVVSVSPGTLFLSRSKGNDYWSCAAVSPNVAAGGALAILDTIMLRLKMAIHLEETILTNARELNPTSSNPNLGVIIETRNALEEMRREMDLPAMMRRRLQKRRQVVAASAAEDAELAEKVFKKFRTMRCR
ncbi:hypothetical protein E2562_006007 [Oryza meyeriana var. granulata]|uniref:Uncharacterized protein n=1 Tax=Oryza meyeriana var. granulata TaxID=110450 RepID=A0A6G1EVB3_9ORYZ|nr:hypothetical protein E2562_006007 [Oryza meyeriana var. granulata]